MCTAGVVNVLRTSVCTSSIFWRRTCYGLGWNLSWWSHAPQNCSGTLNAVKYRDDILDLISFCPFCNSKTLITSFNMTMSDVTWLVFVKTFLTKITSVFFLGRHYHRICHQINIYGMNSVDVFATVTIHRKCYMNCATHLCTSRTTSHKPLSNDWLVLCVGDAKLSLLKEVVTHVTELHKPPYCMTISECPWLVLIMMLRNFVDIALFVMTINKFSIKPLYRYVVQLVHLLMVAVKTWYWNGA